LELTARLVQNNCEYVRNILSRSPLHLTAKSSVGSRGIGLVPQTGFTL